MGAQEAFSFVQCLSSSFCGPGPGLGTGVIMPILKTPLSHPDQGSMSLCPKCTMREKWLLPGRVWKMAPDLELDLDVVYATL